MDIEQCHPSFLAPQSPHAQGPGDAVSVAVGRIIRGDGGYAPARRNPGPGAIETLAGLLVDEVSEPSKHAVYAESLVGSIVAGLLEIPDQTADPSGGRLTQAQINKLNARFDGRCDGRMSVAEMAAIVGLSESWFSNVFKQTTGKTPLQWQLEKRIDVAQKLLLNGDLAVADIAAQLGFSDQAHLTKSFRQVVGDTPAAWRRMRQTG